MSKLSDAYLVTERLHASFFGIDSRLSKQEFALNSIRATVSYTSSRTSNRNETEGVVNGRYAK